MVDELRRLLRVGAEELVVVAAAKRKRADSLRHAEDGHLLVRHLGDPLHVVLRAGGDHVEDDVLSGAAKQRQHAHCVGELVLNRTPFSRLFYF